MNGMRSWLSSALELAGLVSLCVGVFMWSVPAGMVVSGVCAVLVGMAVDE